MIQSAKLIKKDHPHKEATQHSCIETLVNTAWNIAQSALWPSVQLSVRETEKAKSQIGFFLCSSSQPLKAYAVFCQRVLLARNYLLQNSHRYLSLPSVWLNAQNEKGFTGTTGWYQQVQETRASLPNYKIELKAFAEAVLELKTEPTAANFQYWKAYFIERHTPGLLSLFFITIANQAVPNVSKHRQTFLIPP